MKLVLSFVDTPVARHERPDFSLVLLNTLRKESANFGNGSLREIGVNLGIDEQYSLLYFTHRYKDTNFFVSLYELVPDYSLYLGVLNARYVQTRKKNDAEAYG